MTNKIKPNLTKLTPASLAYILRHPEEWPRDYKWDFYTHSCFEMSCGCAMTLAERVFKTKIEHSQEMLEKLGYDPENKTCNIFLDPRVYGLEDDDYDKVTPEMVADKIEEVFRK
jgi:hypothetical protein